MTAEVGIAFGGIRQVFTTRNLHTPGQRGRDAAGQRPVLAAGRALALPAAGRRQPARLPGRTLLNYGFDNATLGRLVGPVFDRIAGSLVDAFVKRAEQVYG
jgi:ribosome-associated toxin RatA of RatAB toxin-antitoxin module